MIVARLEDGRRYPFGAAWTAAFEFLMSMKPDLTEGRYPLRGEEVYVVVAAYQTRRPEECVFEAHRDYVDIQVLVSGEEVIEVAALDDLDLKTPYDASLDAAFYHRPERQVSRVVLSPGMFAMFLPEDAHMPGLVAGERPMPATKVVVKIRTELFAPR